MTEFEIKRVIVTCAAAADIGIATADAAALASRWGVSLHGIYFEDENLYRAAELEIAPHIGLTAAPTPQALTGAVLKEMLERHARDMRRAVEAAAERHRLAWSFRTLRAPSVRALPVMAGDIVIVDAGMRPFSSGWRPRSPWLSAIVDMGITVLLRRGHSGHGVAVVAPPDRAAAGRLVRAVRALIPEEPSIVVLATPPEVGAQIEELQLAAAQKFGIERRSLETPSIVARLNQLDPGLIVVGAEESSAVQRALIEGTRGDLLIVA